LKRSGVAGGDPTFDMRASAASLAFGHPDTLIWGINPPDG
jgi:hypothetical protein